MTANATSSMSKREQKKRPGNPGLESLLEGLSPLKKGHCMKTLSFVVFGCKVSIEPWWHAYEVREVMPDGDADWLTCHYCRTRIGAFLLARRLAKSLNNGWSERAVYVIRDRRTQKEIGAFGARVVSKVVVRYFAR